MTSLERAETFFQRLYVRSGHTRTFTEEDVDMLTDYFEEAIAEEREACVDAVRAMPDGKQYADALERDRLNAAYAGDKP